MGTNGKAPDPWDDDWETKVDQSPVVATTDPLPGNKKLSKAERRAKQAEFNRQLWEEAEAPKDSFFLNTQGDVPLKSDFRPTVKVLSRKPTPKAASTAVVSGFDQLAVEDDDEDDEADAGKYVMTPEERQQKSLREREEKQKKYQEARQRLFGSGTTSETQSKENNVRSPAQQNGESRFQSKDRGRDGRPSSSKSNKKLYEPDAVKTDSNCTYKQENQTESAPIEQHPIRSPRGPENNGRGCFGFTSRGGREI